MRIGLLYGLAGIALFLPPGDGRAEDEPAPAVRTWLESGPPDTCVDVVFVGDGYQKKHLTTSGKYWTDVKRYATRLFQDPPFSWYRSSFNVRAVFLESIDEDCDQASTLSKVETALECTFDTRAGRLLTFSDGAALAKALRVAGDVDIAFVMVNTERYGGAGTTLPAIEVRGRPLPAPTFSARDTASFLIAVHELGHSFATLADEYLEVESQARHKLPEDGSDLSSPNVQRAELLDVTSFDAVARTAKWGHFLSLPGARGHKWAHEGGYFRATGVWRPWPACRMREIPDPFCPICCEELSKAIVAACGGTWDDAAYHKAHPLSLWK